MPDISGGLAPCPIAFPEASLQREWNNPFGNALSEGTAMPLMRGACPPPSGACLRATQVYKQRGLAASVGM